MIDPAILVDGVLRGVLGGRRKRSRRALRYLTGRRGGGSLLNPTTLLTAAGVAWGIFETLQGSQGVQGPSGSWGSGSSGPSGSVGSPGSPLPPLPVTTAAAAVPPDALRMIRLAISAGSADGTLGEPERAMILDQSRAAGADVVIEQELQQRRPLAEIVAGVTDPAHAATLYVLAFAIVRADETVSGAERIYLAQLANLLGLDASMVTKLENQTEARIDAQKE